MPNPGNLASVGGWKDPQTLNARTYICGYCGRNVSSEKGWYTNGGPSYGGIFLCPNCKAPTYFPPSTHDQYPGSSFGNNVEHVPKNLNFLYQESRNCTANANYTAAVLLCRKILMHIAVEQKADEGLKFVEYIDYLSAKGFVPPNGKHWVDHIRKKGNEANHEIVIMDAQAAKELILFIEMLLKFIYEFPNLVPKPAPAS